VPHRAISVPGSPSRWFPHHRRRPPAGFRNLSAVCSPIHLAGLFHPAGTSRLFPPGFFPRREPSRLVAAILPSCRYRESGSLAGDRARSSTSRPCSPGESVASGPRLSEPSARSPLGLPVLSRACFTSAVDRVPTILPSRASLTPVRDGRFAAPQGLVDRRMGRLSRDLQPS
jgi:hypothetical protein